MKRTPLVSAIMLVGKVEPYVVENTIRCFREQTYPNKELIIVNNAHDQFSASQLNIASEPNVYLLDTPQMMSAGMARNYGISVANGPILAQFDCDYWHAPERLAEQITALQEDIEVSLLSSTLSYSFISGVARYVLNELGYIAGTQVFRRPKDIDYPDVEKAEDIAMCDKLGAKMVINKPELACKLYYAPVPVTKITSTVSTEHKKLICKILSRAFVYTETE